MWAQITSGHFCAGLEFDVVRTLIVCDRAAPILNYMEGWTLDRIEVYCTSKKWDMYLFGHSNNLVKKLSQS